MAGSCRVCLVEIKGYENLLASFSEMMADGMEISISSNRAVVARLKNVELVLSNLRINCMECSKRNLRCLFLPLQLLI